MEKAIGKIEFNNRFEATESFLQAYFKLKGISIKRVTVDKHSFFPRYELWWDLYGCECEVNYNGIHEIILYGIATIGEVVAMLEKELKPPTIDRCSNAYLREYTLIQIS